MSDVHDATITSVLFRAQNDPSNPDSLRALLEQYKLFVQTSESLVARRQTVNAFFLSLNTLILGAIGIFAREGPFSSQAFVSMIVFGFTGCILTRLWHRLIHSYRQLNAGKFTVIEALEKMLPASVFTAEWAALGFGRDPSRYRSSTQTEMSISWVFTILYAAIGIVGVVFAAFAAL